MAAASKTLESLQRLVRLVVLSDDRKSVLMYKYKKHWDAPYAGFKLDFANCNLDAIYYLGQELRVDRNQSKDLTPMAELLGHTIATTLPRHPPYTNNSNEDMYHHKTSLVLVERNGQKLHLADKFEWKDSEFLESTLNALDGQKRTGNDLYGEVLKRLITLLREDVHHIDKWDIRMRPGWYSRASDWLTGVMAVDGAKVHSEVRCYRMNTLSTIVGAASNKGHYFCKSSTCGYGELEITKAVHHFFPHFTAELVASNEELYGFVTREFTQVESWDEENGKMRSIALELLASVQLASLRCRHELIQHGVPLFGLSEAAEQVGQWEVDLTMHKRDPSLNRLVQRYSKAVKERLYQLGQYKIPMTLVHGDFSTRNMAFRNGVQGRQAILFDWQLTCISHPFFDLLEGRRKFKGEALEAYLNRWKDFEPLERCREALQLALSVARLVRLRYYVLGMRCDTLEKFPEVVRAFHGEWGKMVN